MRVNKLTCTVEKRKEGAKVMIDGVEFAGVKFISVSPKWVGAPKFKIGLFDTIVKTESTLDFSLTSRKMTDTPDEESYV